MSKIINPLDKEYGKIFPIWTVYYFKKFILSNDKTKINELKKYQEFVYYYLNTSPLFRNILIYHDLGTGKTVTSINIMNMFFAKEKSNIIILLPASLKDSTWKKALKTWSSESLYHKIHFISYNSSTFDKKFFEISNIIDKSISTIYFIDECHNFIHNVFSNMNKTGAQGALSVYNYLLNEQLISSNVRIVTLSATPILSHPFELCLLFNLLRKKTLPETLSSFEEIFMNKSIDNRNMFMRRIIGLVSYYKNTDLDSFPQVIEENKKVIMSSYQYKVYSFYDLKEKQSEQNGAQSYKTFTRSASNFVFPEFNNKLNGETRPRPINFKTLNEYNKQIDLFMKELKLYLKKNVDKKDIIKDFENCKKTENGHIENYIIQNKSISDSLLLLYRMSCKMTSVLYYTYTKNVKHVIYSNFTNVEGLEIMKLYLNILNLSYIEYQGSTSMKDREKGIELFNKSKNKTGSEIKIMLLSSAGLEGISLTNVRYMHVLDPTWNLGNEKQLIGRGVRMNSHQELPISDRNISIYKYFAITKKEGNVTDNYIQDISKKNETKKDFFLDMLKISAIDCELFKTNNMKNGTYPCFHFSQTTYLNYLKGVEVGASHNNYYNNYNNDGLYSSNSESKLIEVRQIKVFFNKKTTNAWFDDLTGIVYDYDFETIPIGIVEKNKLNYYAKYNKDTYFLKTTYDFIKT